MAEAPSRGSAVAVAPSAATTDVGGAAPDPDLLSEETSSLQLPDARELVRRVLALAAAETEALLAGEGPRERLADLAVRVALASWDAQHPPDEALRLLELADGHPLAPRLRLAAALAAGDEAALIAVEPALDAPALQLELAEAWLWRHGRVDRAGAVLERLLDGSPLPPAPVLAAARELAALVHTGGAWQRALELRRSALISDARLGKACSSPLSRSTTRSCSSSSLAMRARTKRKLGSVGCGCSASKSRAAAR